MTAEVLLPAEAASDTAEVLLPAEAASDSAEVLLPAEAASDAVGEGVLAGIVGQAVERPDAPALLGADRWTTYGELHDLAVATVDRLARLDRGPDEPVAVLAPKSPAAVATVLGCLLARVPVLLPAPTLPRPALVDVVERAGCRHLLTPDPGPDRPLRDTGPRHDAGDAALLLTTSGSTGPPKVVPLAVGALDRFAALTGPLFGLGPASTVLNLAPLHFDLCLFDVWTALAHGARVVLVDAERALDGRHPLDLASRHGATVVQSVPLFLGRLLDAAGGTGATLPTVRHVLCTGDVLPDPVRAGLPGLFPGARLHNVYGCTETNDSFVHEITAADPPGPLPIGAPLPGVAALVLDTAGRAVPGAGAGELWVSTPFQSGGYRDVTGPAPAGRFGPHPVDADARIWFRTGDLVRRDEAGRLLLVGRSDFQVKVRGVAVDTAEVERVLLTHPDVLEAAVVAVPDPVGGRALTAAVRRDPACALTSLHLRGHCAAHLPRAAIPATLRILDEPLPRTSTGKVDRQAVGVPVPRTERRVS